MGENISITEFLVELILNNTRLGYKDGELRIDNESPIMETIRVLAKTKYENRLLELQKSNEE